MALDQSVVLENLVSQQEELVKSINTLQAQIKTAETQYLKISGAVEVLTQLVEEEDEAPVVEPEVQTENE